MLATLALIAVLAWPAAAAAPQPEHLEQLAGKLQQDLQRIAGAAPGVVGVSIVDVTSGRRFGVNDTWTFPQGSAIKIPILIELYRRVDQKDLKISDRIALRRSDQVGGSGLLQHFVDGGSELSLHDLAIARVATKSNVIGSILGALAAAVACEHDGNNPVDPDDVLKKLDALEKRSRFE